MLEERVPEESVRIEKERLIIAKLEMNLDDLYRESNSEMLNGSRPYMSKYPIKAF